MIKYRFLLLILLLVVKLSDNTIFSMKLKGRALFVRSISSVIVSSILIHPTSCFAEPKLPKMEYFNKEDDTKVGQAVYNEIDLSTIDSKIKSITNDWNNMISKVEIALKKNQKSDAQSAIANTMGSLKANMRQLAKILNNGDIIVRNDNGNELNAEFNFNTGQFKLRPIAQKTEDVINAVNDFYFYESQETTESSLYKLTMLKTLFSEWVKVIKN